MHTHTQRVCWSQTLSLPSAIATQLLPALICFLHSIAGPQRNRHAAGAAGPSRGGGAAAGAGPSGRGHGSRREASPDPSIDTQELLLTGGPDPDLQEDAGTGTDRPMDQSREAQDSGKGSKLKAGGVAAGAQGRQAAAAAASKRKRSCSPSKLVAGGARPAQVPGSGGAMPAAKRPHSGEGPSSGGGGGGGGDQAGKPEGHGHGPGKDHVHERDAPMSHKGAGADTAESYHDGKQGNKPLQLQDLLAPLCAEGMGKRLLLAYLPQPSNEDESYFAMAQARAMLCV